MRPDHFHVNYEMPDGSLHSMEGGLTVPLVDEFMTKFAAVNDHLMKDDDYSEWYNHKIHELAIDWGMPKEAKIKAFWMAG